AFGVTEPNSGSDTTKLQTTAVRTGDRYVVNGRKIFISRALQSDLMLLLARTTPVDRISRRTDGLSVFLVDIRGLKGLEIRPLRMMMNHSTNALFFDDMEIPADSLVGEEGRGFSYILDGMNAERVLGASESGGDGRWFTERAVAYSGQRYGFAEEYDVERKFRECRLYKTAPVNNNLVLAYVGEHVLGMPRSY